MTRVSPVHFWCSLSSSKKNPAAQPLLSRCLASSEPLCQTKFSSGLVIQLGTGLQKPREFDEHTTDIAKNDRLLAQVSGLRSVTQCKSKRATQIPLCTVLSCPAIQYNCQLLHIIRKASACCCADHHLCISVRRHACGVVRIEWRVAKSFPCPPSRCYPKWVPPLSYRVSA